MRPRVPAAMGRVLRHGRALPASAAVVVTVLVAVVVWSGSLAVLSVPAGATSPAVIITPAETQPGGQVSVASPSDVGCPAGSSPFVAILGRTVDGLVLQTESLPLSPRGGTWRTVLTIPDDTAPGTYAMVARCFTDAENPRPRVEYEAANLVVRQQRLGRPRVDTGPGRQLVVSSADACVPPARTSPAAAGPVTLRVSLIDAGGAVRDQIIAGVRPDGTWNARLTAPAVAETTAFRVLASCRATTDARAPYAVYAEAVVQVEGQPTTTTRPAPTTTAPILPPEATPAQPPVAVVVPTQLLPAAAPAVPVMRQPSYTG